MATKVRPTGRAPAETDERTLRFGKYARYLDESGKIAPRWAGIIPTGDGYFDDGSSRSAEFRWNALGNETYKNCVPAAMLDLNRAWHGRNGTFPAVSRDDALRIYTEMSSFEFDERDQANSRYDVGASVLAGLKHWAKIDEETNGLPPIHAFADCESGNLEQIRDAIHLFGGVLAGLQLPVSAQDEEEHWTVPPYGPIHDGTPGSWESHCVPLVGYTPRRITFISWGKPQTMSWEFLSAYCDEVYVVFPKDPPHPFETGLYPALEADRKAAAEAPLPTHLPVFRHPWRAGGSKM